MEKNIQTSEDIKDLKSKIREADKHIVGGIARLIIDFITTIILMVGAAYISTKIGIVLSIVLIVFQVGYVAEVVRKSIELIKLMRITLMLRKISVMILGSLTKGEEGQQVVVSEE